MMSCKEATWNETQATLADLEDEVKDLKLQVKDRDKLVRKGCRPRYTQLFETERVKEELNAKLNQIRLMELSFNKKMEDMIFEKDAVIAKVTEERVALEHQNLELVTKLTVIQTEVVSNQSEWKTEITALEDSVKTEQEVKEACTEKMEDTEEKCAAKQEDILNQASSIEEDIELLMDKNTELQEPAWKTVNTKAGSRKKRRKNQRCK
ncbi:structural maintenance of chromosomes protein 2-like isoform X2 [Paralichthys olivaceus]